MASGQQAAAMHLTSSPTVVGVCGRFNKLRTCLTTSVATESSKSKAEAKTSAALPAILFSGRGLVLDQLQTLPSVGSPPISL